MADSGYESEHRVHGTLDVLGPGEQESAWHPVVMSNYCEIGLMVFFASPLGLACLCWLQAQRELSWEMTMAPSASGNNSLWMARRNKNQEFW